MTDLKRKGEHTKDKIAGEVKEAVGKVTGNEELELKGKIQSSKADLSEKVDEIKEGIAEKVNKFTDKKKEK